MVWLSKQVQFALLQTYVFFKCLFTIRVDEEVRALQRKNRDEHHMWPFLSFQAV